MASPNGPGVPFQIFVFPKQVRFWGPLLRKKVGRTSWLSSCLLSGALDGCSAGSSQAPFGQSLDGNFQPWMGGPGVWMGVSPDPGSDLAAFMAPHPGSFMARGAAGRRAGWTYCRVLILQTKLLET